MVSEILEGVTVQKLQKNILTRIHLSHTWFISPEFDKSPTQANLASWKQCAMDD